MSPSPSTPRGMYFDEFEPGLRIITAGRTITEADIVNFAGLSGDFNQIHMDEEYCKDSPFGQRVAHGLLVMSVIQGLGVQSGFMEGTVIAFREIENWKFAKPVFIGDTVHGELEITETKYLRRLSGGSISIDVKVKNQHEEVVMKGTWIALIAERPQ